MHVSMRNDYYFVSFGQVWLLPFDRAGFLSFIVSTYLKCRPEHVILLEAVAIFNIVSFFSLHG